MPQQAIAAASQRTGPDAAVHVDGVAVVASLKVDLTLTEIESLYAVAAPGKRTAPRARIRLVRVAVIASFISLF